MLYYNRIGISKGIDPTKSNRSRECTILHYSFYNHGFKFQIMYAMVLLIWQC